MILTHTFILIKGRGNIFGTLPGVGVGELI